MAITNRDEAIFQFVNVFGKSYPEVLGNTFFKGSQQARNRLRSLKQMEMIDYRPTGLLKHRNALVLTSQGRNYLTDRGIDARTSVKIHTSTIVHNVIEQICYYWLKQLGKVERTTVYHHAAILNHVPDLIYTDDKGRKFYIEVELNQKSMNNYENILAKTQRDDPFGVIYVTENTKSMISLAKNMPKWNKLYYIDINKFVDNIRGAGKIMPSSQESLAVSYV